MKKKFQYIGILLLVGVVITACAKMGSPVGGPKDYTPPVMVNSGPENFATNFHGKRIKINFDENVQLKDLNTNFFVSPPMLKKPSVIVRNKTIDIAFEEELKPYTTYRFAFGNAVADLNEGNPLENFEFVVSTCSIIDSLSLHGRVISAYDHTPDKEGYFVMLYDKFEDSIPHKQLPVYITKTSEKGWFSFQHIRPDTFRILALKDANQNFLFDLPTEPIAFSDTLVAIDQRFHLQTDSIVSDTVKIDSLKRVRKVPKPQMQLYSFSENHKKQYLDKYDRKKPNQFELLFTLPIADSLNIEPLNFKNTSWLLPDKPIKDDTINFWITDTTIVNTDTLKLKVSYSSTDSAENWVQKSDTIKLSVKKLAGAKNAKGNQKNAKKVKEFKLISPADGKNTFDLNGQFILEPTNPISTIDTSQILVFKTEEVENDKGKEKKKKPVKFILLHDSLLLRSYYLKFPLEPSTSYSVSIDTASIKDIYGEVNDSTGFNFKTQKEEFYGKIKLTLSNVNCPMMVQLLNEKENVLSQKYILKDQSVTFDYLYPAKYKLKVIYDKNGNKVWDTGSFDKNLQPEKVLYFDKIIQVKSNWDMDETWKLE